VVQPTAIEASVLASEELGRQRDDIRYRRVGTPLEPSSPW